MKTPIKITIFMLAAALLPMAASAQIAYTGRQLNVGGELEAMAAGMLEAYCYVKKLDGAEAGTLKCEYFYAGLSDGTITVADLAGNTLLQSVCPPGKGTIEVKTRNAVKSVYVVSLSSGDRTVKTVKITN